MEIKNVVENVKAKVETIDVDQIKDEIKGLDTGVLYTKAQDAVASLDISGKKQAVIDFIDSPKMEEIKGVLRTVKDFAGFVPNYLQSVPTMVKEALGIEK